MAHVDPDSVAANVGGSRVLVCVEDDDTRAVLLEWLSPRFEVVDEEDRDLADTDPDVCIVDWGGLDATRSALTDARDAASSAYFPVLFVFDDPDASEGDGPPAADHDDLPASLVDETISQPIRLDELARRLRSLLHIRSLSVELSDRDRRYRELLDLLASGVCLVEDGQIVHLNDAGRRLFDVEDADAVLGQPFIEFVAESDTDAVEAFLGDVADGQTADIACSLVTTTEQTAPVTLAGVVTEPGTPPQVQLVVRDQRDHVHRDERIELFTAAIESAAHGITIVDVSQSDEPLVYVNEAFSQITGYSAAESLGKNCRFLQGEETNPADVAQMRAALDAREPTTCRVLNYRADGTPFWNQIHLIPVQRGDEPVTHYLGFQRDVSERVQREQELERYRSLVQAADDPIYTLDADGHFVEVNTAFLDFFGYEQVDLVGAHATTIVDDQDVAKCEQLIQEMLTESDSSGQKAEVVAETADGQRRLCEVSLGLLQSDGAFRGTVGIVRDITEPRGREQRLAVLERVIRHNLRNKTNVVLSRAERIQHSGSLPADLESDVTEIADAATDLIEISEQARQFRDVVMFQHDELTTQDVVTVVEDIVADKRQAHAEADIETALPETAVALTRSHFRISVDELVENAVLHSESETPTVSVSVTDAASDVVIQIKDDGPGIPEYERSIVTRETENPLEHSSGIGLWLVRWVIEQSGGTIQFEDDDDWGTVATIRLPRAD